jgi:hypothetical protein
VVGIGSQWLASRLKLPSILLLLVAGIVAGPATQFIVPATLFGDLLLPMVSLAIALILFEGAMTLRISELKIIGGFSILAQECHAQSLAERFSRFRRKAEPEKQNSKAKVPELTWQTYEKIRDRIRPSNDEDAWRLIPWKSDLSDALDAAAKRNVPVLIWTMNGDPLGCT